MELTRARVELRAILVDAVERVTERDLFESAAMLCGDVGPSMLRRPCSHFDGFLLDSNGDAERRRP